MSINVENKRLDSFLKAIYELEDCIPLETSSSSYLETLDRKIWYRILSHLNNPIDLLNIQLSCKRFHERLFKEIKDLNPFAMLDCMLIDSIYEYDVSISLNKMDYPITLQKFKDKLQYFYQNFTRTNLSSFQVVSDQCFRTFSLDKSVEIIFMMHLLYCTFHLWKRSEIFDGRLDFLISSLSLPCFYNLKTSINSYDCPNIKKNYRLLCMLHSFNPYIIVKYIISNILNNPHIDTESLTKNLTEISLEKQKVFRLINHLFEQVIWFKSFAKYINYHQDLLLQTLLHEYTISTLESWIQILNSNNLLSSCENDEYLILFYGILNKNIQYCKPFAYKQAITFYQKHIMPIKKALLRKEKQLLQRISYPTSEPYIIDAHPKLHQDLINRHINEQIIVGMEIFIPDITVYPPFKAFNFEFDKNVLLHEQNNTDSDILEKLPHWNRFPAKLLLEHLSSHKRICLYEDIYIPYSYRTFVQEIQLETYAFIIQPILDHYKKQNSELLSDIPGLLYTSSDNIQSNFKRYFSFAACMDAFQESFHEYTLKLANPSRPLLKPSIDKESDSTTSLLYRTVSTSKQSSYDIIISEMHRTFDLALDELISSGLSILLDMITAHFEAIIKETLIFDSLNYEYKDHFPAIVHKQKSICLLKLQSTNSYPKPLCIFAFDLLHSYTCLLINCTKDIISYQSSTILPVLLHELGSRIFQSWQSIVKECHFSPQGGDRLVQDMRSFTWWAKNLLHSKHAIHLFESFELLVTIYSLSEDKLKIFLVEHSPKLLSIWKTNELIEFASCRQDFSSIASLFESKCSIW